MSHTQTMLLGLNDVMKPDSDPYNTMFWCSLVHTFDVFFKQWLLEAHHPAVAIKLTLPADQAQANQ